MKTRRRLALVLAVLVPAALGIGRLAHEPAPHAEQRSSASTQGSAKGSNIRPVEEPRAERPGRVLRYLSSNKRSYHLDLQRRIELPSDQQKSERLDTRIKGLWTVAVSDSDEVRAHLRVTLEQPEISLGPAGRDALSTEQRQRIVAEIRRPFFLTVTQEGRVETIHLPRNMDLFAMGLLKALASATQSIVKSGSAWEVEETDVTGDYLVSYQRDEAGLSRAKLRYLRVAGPGGLVPSERAGQINVHSKGHLKVDGPSLQLAGLEESEVLHILPGGKGTGMPEIRSTGHVTLTLKEASTDVEVVGSFLDEDSSGYVTSSLVNLGGAQVKQADHDQQLLAGLGYEELTKSLASLGQEAGEKQARILAQMEAFLRQNPDRSTQVLDTLREGQMTGGQKSVLVAALGGAGTKEAQAVLADVVGDSTFGDLRVDAAIGLGLCSKPVPGSLLSLHKVIGSSFRDLHSTALLALGTLAKTLLSGESDQDKEAGGAEVERLIALYGQAKTVNDQILLLKALGNTGSQRIWSVIAVAMLHKHPAVRAAAFDSLRFFEGSQADQALTGGLSDPDQEVRRVASETQKFRAERTSKSPR